MRNTFATLLLIAASATLTPIHAAPAVMTNQTIQAMLSGGVPLPTIIRAIKTAPKIDLYINDHELIRLKNAGASPAEAAEIFKAIHYREYVGIDTSPTEPVERIQVPVARIKTPAVPPPAPVIASAPPAPNPAPPPPPATPAVPPTFAPEPTPVPQSAPLPTAPPAPAPPAPAPPAPAPDTLSDTEVNQAILMGMATGRHTIGLVLNDLETSLLSPMVCPTCAQSGYTIHVYTAKQWIEQMVVNNRREMLPFTAADVTPEMRLKMLHVVAMPSTPAYLNGNGFALSSSVHRIVIADMSRNVIVQPVELSNGSVETNSAFRSATFSSANAAFMMSDVARLRASDSKGEFFIAVTGSGQNKFFRVKQRFFTTLFN